MDGRWLKSYQMWSAKPVAAATDAESAEDAGDDVLDAVGDGLHLDRQPPVLRRFHCRLTPSYTSCCLPRKF